MSEQLANWQFAPDVWRSLRSTSLSSVDLLFRAFSAGRLPHSLFHRLYHLGIPDEVVDQTLGAIRRLDEWSTLWTETAQGFLGTSRRETSAGNLIEAERARYIAAMCYHVAQILELRDLRVRNSCRAWVASLCKQALPVVHPHARHVMVPWRDQQLPALLEVPQHGEAPFGLVVLFNGISQCKEETFRIAPRFLDTGYAVLAIDSPGTGEATSLGPQSASATDIIDGALAGLQRDGLINPHRVVLMGSSFGGTESIRIGRRLSQVMAVVAVTPAIQPAVWMDYASPILIAELDDMVAGRTPREVAESFDALVAARAVSMPILVFGAGMDAIVPPNESQKLAETLGNRATLVWYPDLGHCLYGALDQVSAETVAWLSAIEQGRAKGIEDAAALNLRGTSAIDAYTWTPRVSDDDGDDGDFAEYARLLPADHAPG